MASRINSERSRPAGSNRTPEPSMMAIVLSLLSSISSAPAQQQTGRLEDNVLDPRSPSGPPVWNCAYRQPRQKSESEGDLTLVTSFSFSPCAFKTPRMYCRTDSDVIPSSIVSVPLRLPALTEIMGNTTKHFGALASSEALPPTRSSSSGMLGRPVHKVCSIL